MEPTRLSLKTDTSSTTTTTTPQNPQPSYLSQICTSLGNTFWGTSPNLTEKNLSKTASNAVVTTSIENTSTAIPGWTSSKINCYPMGLMQASAKDGTIAIQRSYKLKDNVTFTVQSPTIVLPTGIQTGGVCPEWLDAYWITSFGGILKVPTNGIIGPLLYPIPSPDYTESSVLIPEYCHGTKGLTIDYTIGLIGFSIFDFSTNVPKQLFHQDNFEAIFRKLGNNHLLCFFEGQNNNEAQDALQLWNVETQQLEWCLTNQDNWFKRDGGTYFGFRQVMPSPGIVVADVGRDVYFINIKEKNVKRIRIDGPENSLISPLKFIDQDKFICRYYSSNIVHYYSAESGQKINNFAIGQNLQYDTDGFPLVVNGHEMVALDINDSAKLTLWNLDTGKTSDPYAPADRPLHELYLSDKGDRIIGLHQQNYQNPDGPSVLYVWDYHSGKLLLRSEYEGQLAFNSMSNNILALDHSYMNIITHAKESKRNSNHLPEEATREIRSNDQPLAIYITLWDLNTDCRKAADITENFAPANVQFKLIYNFKNVRPGEYELNAWWSPSNTATLIKKSYKLS